MTDHTPDLSTSVDDPSHPWNLNLTEAKEMMIVGMRDFAETREEVEVYVQLGTMSRLGWIEHVLRQQKNAFIRKQKKAQRAQALAKKGATS